MTNSDFYTILGLDKTTATNEDIKRAYRKLAVKLHPDKQDPDKKTTAEKEFGELNHAYNVLSDPEKKQIYDQGGDNNVYSFEDSAFASLFTEFFKNTQTHVYIQELQVSLSDVLYGNDTMTVSVPMLITCDKCQGSGAASPKDVIPCLRCNGQGVTMHAIGPGIIAQSTCTACFGKGKIIKSHRQCTECNGTTRVHINKEFCVNVPRGVRDGQRLVVDNSHVVIQVVYKLDDCTWIKGNDVHFRLPSITLKELFVGFVRKLDMYGKKVVFKSSGYFNPTQPKKLLGRGLPCGVGSNQRGDAYIHYQVIFEDQPGFGFVP